ncbi:putative kinesin [Leishmania infantum JPCM5]|uniref:Kinesin_-_putative n=2 Tax=Leishmania infantum TaxID=5671 RepID=A0A6L0X444_LEIIN|nr:putative kinesin [Leishmania infantum JPCM5]CAC9478646.1 kinesin_-_putative [Leishmania infantum]CAM59807.1 putative kinesin [Leishmania infantum JPCM5]SUZ40885.1 kinesin_-_putative [Leishmania infantum]|eukprot:XP_001464779.1 putative kinesin [Leishmania infantum JPCM5]
MSTAAVSRPRVYVRIRPLNDREVRDGKGELACRGDTRQQDVLFLKKDETLEQQVRFDQVFDQCSNQQLVFDHIGPEILRTLFSGYNASVFAYGQTGSGKTYTMEGDRGGGVSGGASSEEQEGLIPRIIRGIFSSFKSNANITDALVEVSLVQIYQERIQDLLNHRKQVEIHMDRTSQYVARDATWRTVRSLEECMKLYGEACKMRATSATEMNLVSSRSHMILMLRMQWDEPALPGSHAQLNMIDLAGSERLNESGATGETMKETITINKSLSALGNVVVKLVEQAKKPNKRIHIPYKDSKLTYLLQSSLGGANLVHFMLSVSGSAMWRSETTSTIEFGKRALQLVLRPVRNAIDYTRLAEMEAMIERMRSHIESLEEELQLKRNFEAAGFLQLRQIAQSDDDPAQRRRRQETSANHKHLKRQTELTRIMANLPETFDDLTSHCVLFPESKVTFRELGGLEKLIHFVGKSASNYYRASAAQTIASVIDEPGREVFASLGGLNALAMLLRVQEERCKEAACVALEAVCRGCVTNKRSLSADVYAELVDLVYGYSNQQVQEAACAAVASIVDGYAEATRRFERLDVVPKLLETIRTCPAEVVNLTKAATNCVGRLAHGDKEMQQTIASLGGVDLLIDVLFSSSGDRDHQVPILASYALVNLCCSSHENLKMAMEHSRYGEVKFRLLEGLARAFGTNTSREGFGRATAQETAGPFPYYGVTIQDEWTYASSGGRPIFSTFMDNPQFHLYVREETDIAFIIQDTLYEARMRKKRRNNSVYMGIAIFEGDPTLAKLGLKQLDFHGKMIEIGRYTSNCENVLHCTLPASDTPYMVVPFTSQKGRHTHFALSAFGNHPIELTSVPDQVGWVHTVLQGKWTEFTGRGGETFDWRCNPQIRLKTKEACRVVFVLSYLSLDEQRAQLLQEEEEGEGQNTRPRLHGRLFSNAFAVHKRYLKAIVPLPQGSTFVASNTFASNSYITTSANLDRSGDYVYIPFTETPFQDTYRVSVYCDSDEVEIKPMQGQSSEWMCASLSGVWQGKPVSVDLDTTGKLVAVMYSPGAFVRPRLLSGFNQKRIAGIDSYWNTEATVEYDSNGQLTLQVEAMMRSGTPSAAAARGTTQSATNQVTQVPATDIKFDLFIFTDRKCTLTRVGFDASPSSWPCPTQSTSQTLLAYPQLVEDVDAVGGDDDDNSDSLASELWRDDPGNISAAEQEARETELLRLLEKQEAANHILKLQLAQQARELEELRNGGVSATTSSNSDGKRGGSAKPSGTKTPKRTPSATMDGYAGLSEGRHRSRKEFGGGGSAQAPLHNPSRVNTSGSAEAKGAAAKPPSTGPAQRGTNTNSAEAWRQKPLALAGTTLPTNRPGMADNTASAAPSPQVKELVNYTLVKLIEMSKRAATSARLGDKKEDREWRAMLKDIEEVHQRLHDAFSIL